MDCKKEICCVKVQFQYPKMTDQCWDVEDLIKKFNFKFRHMKGRGNVYGIFTCNQGKCNIVYVGTSKKPDLDGRIQEHLVKKSKSTNSKLECVKPSVRSGYGIGISYILVELDSLRLFVEQELIEKLDPPWNKRQRLKVDDR